MKASIRKHELQRVEVDVAVAKVDCDDVAGCDAHLFAVRLLAQPRCTRAARGVRIVRLQLLDRAFRDPGALVDLFLVAQEKGRNVFANKVLLAIAFGRRERRPCLVPEHVLARLAFVRVLRTVHLHAVHGRKQRGKGPRLVGVQVMRHCISTHTYSSGPRGAQSAVQGSCRREVNPA